MECLAAAGAVCGARRDTTGDKVSDGESYGEWYRSGIACTSISRAFDGAEKVICFVEDGEPTHCCRGRREDGLAARERGRERGRGRRRLDDARGAGWDAIGGALVVLRRGVGSCG